LEGECAKPNWEQKDAIEVMAYEQEQVAGVESTNTE